MPRNPKKVTIETRRQRRDESAITTPATDTKKPAKVASKRAAVAQKPAKKAVSKKSTEPAKTAPKTAAAVAKSVQEVKRQPVQKPSRWNRLKNFLSQHKAEVALVTTLLVISGVAHAWNMFAYPYLENDEATYTSRAWAFATTGQLDVYTYRYDHAPLGWMLLGFWQLLTGGAKLFGSLLDSGRIFMLVIHLASTGVLYVLARRFSGGNRLAAATAALVFALSPLAIYFQRRILLDNIMTFWLLLSILLVTNPRRRLNQYINGGLAFGIAVLTKLNAVFVGPAFLYIIWRRAKREHRMHAISYWLAAAGITVAGFFLFALLKGELFAAPIGPDGKPAHVSVVDTFSLQLGRGDFAWFWDTKGSFMQNVDSWWQKDWFTLAVGAASTIILTIVGFLRRQKEPYLLFVALLCWCMFAFLARGKIVLDLYIVPVVPLLALAFGLVVGLLSRGVTTKAFKIAFTTGVIAILALAYGGMVANKQYFVDETTNQQKALDWVVKNVPKDALIATDNYAYPTLAQEHGFKNVSYFFSAEYDPEVRKTYGDDWRNIEYLIVTHEVIEQIKTGTVPHMRDIFDHAVLLADYRQGASSFIDLRNYISTNGDWAQVYKVKNRAGIIQQDSWGHFKDEFVVDYGQVVDKSNNDQTSSGGQATAMVRALEAGDKDMFGGLWQWSKDHLRHRSTDVLLSWSWQKQADGTYGLGDSNTVCDADQTVAYALLKAGETWNMPAYTQAGKAHLADWWSACVFERGGKLYVDSSADGSNDIRLLNPGYFNPAYYRYFAKGMPSLPWPQLIDDGYGLTAAVYDRWQSIPNWAVMNEDGSLQSAEPLVGAGADSFGFDSLQLIPHLVADQADPRAAALLQNLITPVDAFTGQNPGPAAKAAQLLLWQATSHGTAKDRQAAYQSVVYKPYHAKTGAWHDGKNYRDHVWLWQWLHSQTDLPQANRIPLK